METISGGREKNDETAEKSEEDLVLRILFLKKEITKYFSMSLLIVEIVNKRSMFSL